VSDSSGAPGTASSSRPRLFHDLPHLSLSLPLRASFHLPGRAVAAGLPSGLVSHLAPRNSHLAPHTLACCVVCGVVWAGAAYPARLACMPACLSARLSDRGLSSSSCGLENPRSPDRACPSVLRADVRRRCRVWRLLVWCGPPCTHPHPPTHTHTHQNTQFHSTVHTLTPLTPLAPLTPSSVRPRASSPQPPSANVPPSTVHRPPSNAHRAAPSARCRRPQTPPATRSAKVATRISRVSVCVCTHPYRKILSWIGLRQESTRPIWLHIKTLPSIFTHLFAAPRLPHVRCTVGRGRLRTDAAQPDMSVSGRSGHYRPHFSSSCVLLSWVRAVPLPKQFGYLGSRPHGARMEAQFPHAPGSRPTVGVRLQMRRLLS
jgi:hypothetical protein